MKIGVLQCGHLEPGLRAKHGCLHKMFTELLTGYGLEFENFSVVDGQFPKSIVQCDGWLITGSVHGAYDDLPWIAPLEVLIRDVYAKGIPITGICFGHQIMAQALGGKVEKFGGGWGMGQASYNLEDLNKITLLAMHQDQVTEIPPEARVTASSDFCTNAALAYEGRALSFQPHPEFTPEFMHDLIHFKMENGLPREIGEQAIDTIKGVSDSELIASQLANFYLDAHNQHSKSQAAE